MNGERSPLTETRGTGLLALVWLGRDLLDLEGHAADGEGDGEEMGKAATRDGPLK